MDSIKVYYGYTRSKQGSLRRVELRTGLPIHHFLYNNVGSIKAHCEKYDALYPILVPIKGGKS